MKKIDIKSLIQKIDGQPSVFENTYDQSKIATVSTKGMTNIPKEWIEINYKAYPRFKQFPLIEPTNDTDLTKAIINRSSKRDFTGKPLSSSYLSTLLKYSCGLTYNGKDWDDARRAYPSAGGRFPLEVYVVLPNTENIPEGIFHYNIKGHRLEEVLKGNQLNRIAKFVGQDWLNRSSAIFLISAVHRRTSVKYLGRSVRHIFLEAGHLGQNLYLLATELNLGCCAIGGWADDKINKLLDLDQSSEAVVYIVAIGTL